MGMSKKKIAALDNLRQSIIDINAHRGLPMANPFIYEFYDTTPIKKIIEKTEANMCALKEEVPAATDKQLNFISILLNKEYNRNFSDAYNLKLIEDKVPNKYQASLLISLLKDVDNMIYGGGYVTKEMFDENETEVFNLMNMFK